MVKAVEAVPLAGAFLRPRVRAMSVSFVVVVRAGTRLEV
jgi:hypothetical protein